MGDAERNSSAGRNVRLVAGWSAGVQVELSIATGASRQSIERRCTNIGVEPPVHAHLLERLACKLRSKSHLYEQRNWTRNCFGEEELRMRDSVLGGARSAARRPH